MRIANGIPSISSWPVGPKARRGESTGATALVMWQALLAASLLTVAVGGCPPDDTGVFGPSEELRFKDVSIDTGRPLHDDKIVAEIGDTVTIKWDYEDQHLLQDHWVELRVASLFGEIRYDQAHPRTDQEDFECRFEFQGPVTVSITAEDELGDLISVAWDIHLSETYFVRAEVEGLAGPAADANGHLRFNRTYPNLGYPSATQTGQTTNEAVIEFTHFFGCYDASGDGLIDEFARDPAVARLLPPSLEFRGLSTRPFVSQFFGFEAGCKFPVLTTGFQSTSDGAAFPGFTEPVTALIFGGKIAYDGEETTARVGNDKDGYEETIVHTGELDFEQIFICVAVAVDDAGTPYVADIHIGNLNQGFVVTVFHGPTTGRRMGSGLVSANLNWPYYSDKVGYTLPGWGEVGEMGGWIKGSMLGMNCDALSSVGPGGVPDTTALVRVRDLRWHVPLYPDTDLGGRVPVRLP
jgi:hypothetical protein